MNDVDRRFVLRGGAACALSIAGGPAIAGPSTPASRAVRLPVRLQDVMMTDARSRRQVGLVRDIMGSRVVVLNFMLLGCSTVCPIQSQILSRTQKLLDTRMGRDVVFVSVTLNPVGDTPARLTSYADQNAAGSGWHFLRGDFEAVGRLRQGFDNYSPVVEDHPPVFSIGRASAARWSRLYGMPRPEALAGEVKGWLTA